MKKTRSVKGYAQPGMLLTVAVLAVLIPTARLLRQSPAAVLRIDH